MNCVINDCTNKGVSKFRNHCQTHYRTLLGTPALPRMKRVRSDRRNDEQCTVADCDTNKYARNYCKNHYDKFMRWGQPERPDPEHGTSARYGRGCRCEPCTDAYNMRIEEWRERRFEQLECGHPQKYYAGCRCEVCREAHYGHLVANNEHGTIGRYNGGCRCLNCRTAHSEYKAAFWLNNDMYRLRQLARESNRRAADAGTPGTVTAEDLATLFDTYTECLACGTGEHLSVDHVVPTSQGGSNTLSNMQVLCVSCNSRKGQGSTDYRANVAVA